MKLGKQIYRMIEKRQLFKYISRLAFNRSKIDVGKTLCMNADI